MQEVSNMSLANIQASTLGLSIINSVAKKRGDADGRLSDLSLIVIDDILQEVLRVHNFNKDLVRFNASSIRAGFFWEQSPQGFVFWANLMNRYPV
jgi:hypothetical protein